MENRKCVCQRIHITTDSHAHPSQTTEERFCENVSE